MSRERVRPSAWIRRPGRTRVYGYVTSGSAPDLLGDGLDEPHFSGQRLLPVGTVYDPFVCRGLDALIYALYSGASFVFAGTPSGVTLAPEGGAHQSTITASIGVGVAGPHAA